MICNMGDFENFLVRGVDMVLTRDGLGSFFHGAGQGQKSTGRGRVWRGKGLNLQGGAGKGAKSAGRGRERA